MRYFDIDSDQVLRRVALRSFLVCSPFLPSILYGCGKKVPFPPSLILISLKELPFIKVIIIFWPSSSMRRSADVGLQFVFILFLFSYLGFFREQVVTEKHRGYVAEVIWVLVF